MKLTSGLLAVWAGCAAAAQPLANVFVISPPGSSTAATTTATTIPTLPRSIARHILLQRLAPVGGGLSVKDLPTGVDSEKAIAALNQFGKTWPPLLSNSRAEEPLQLVLMLEDLTEEQIEDTVKSLKVQPSFTVSEPPSAKAHDELARYDFYNMGVTNEHSCALHEVSNPFADECWSGGSTFARYSVKQDPEVLGSFISRLPILEYFAKHNQIETVVLLLPEVNESSAPKSWSDRPQELRRRQLDETERVITSFGKAISHAKPTSNFPDNHVLQAPSGPIPPCFMSLESCISSTGNCSHQGQCMDKFASSSNAKGADVCFACHCMSTKSGEKGPVTHWAGPTCAKKDVSVPFWLFVGLTLLLIGSLTLAVSMLYSIGEERLPGVIGAGVSRSK